MVLPAEFLFPCHLHHQSLHIQDQGHFAAAQNGEAANAADPVETLPSG